MIIAESRVGGCDFFENQPVLIPKIIQSNPFYELDTPLGDYIV